VGTPSTEEPLAPKRTVYRWDLDKTYLSTDFDSLRGLVRTAFEKASDKRTFPGASVLLRELCATSPAGLFILSGSPQQMRKVIEEKLVLDGIRWDGLVLKPSLNRLLRGRFRFLRDQVSYKLGALLRSRASISAPHEIMFGDDAEADAFVYSFYADVCAGRVGLSVLASVLELSRAYDDDAAELLELARACPRADFARRIFIHLERVEPSAVFADFGPRVCAFHNYFQPAVVLLEDRLIGADAVLRVGLELVDVHDFSPEVLGASFADLARRGVIGLQTGQALAEEIQRYVPGSMESAEAVRLLARAVASCALPTRGLSTAVTEPLDYVALLTRDKVRAHRAKSRARARAPR
jgi:hypothetical protein